VRITLEWRMADDDDAPLIFKRTYRFEPGSSADIEAISRAFVEFDVLVRPLAMRYGRVDVALVDVNPLPEMLAEWRHQRGETGP
jgi:hypothetical protein